MLPHHCNNTVCSNTATHALLLVLIVSIVKLMNKWENKTNAAAMPTPTNRSSRDTLTVLTKVERMFFDQPKRFQRVPGSTSRPVGKALQNTEFNKLEVSLISSS